MPHRSATTTRLLLRGLAVGASLVLLTGPWAAIADPADPLTPGSTSPAERRAAESALARVQAALDRPVPRTATHPLPHRDLTLKLRDLRLGLDALSADERDLARALLARPTDGVTGDPMGDGYSHPNSARDTCTEQPSPSQPVCVHWVPANIEPLNAPSSGDEDSDDVPDFVELARDTLGVVWTRIVSDGGYRKPVGDPLLPRTGPDERLDVYLTDIGDDGFYGYCVPEYGGPGRTASGYCVLDNDYDSAQYGGDATQNLQVTAAHEFFHAVQFAYDVDEDSWLMEGTAAWVEDMVYPEVRDNRQFVPGGQMTHPRVALDAYGFGNAQFYHSWTWWRFLGDRVPETGGGGMPRVIREIWQRAVTRDVHSLRATAETLASSGRSFTGMLATYGEAKLHPGTAFADPQGLPTMKPVSTYTVRAGTRTTQKTATLPHLTSQTFRFVPGTGTSAASWRLRIPVDAPDLSRGSHVQVSVARRNGARTVRAVKLNSRGVGSVITDFSSTMVARVDLTITNAGRRYTCWRGTDLACQGQSLDNGLQTKFRGVTFRA